MCAPFLGASLGVVGRETLPALEAGLGEAELQAAWGDALLLDHLRPSYCDFLQQGNFGSLMAGQHWHRLGRREAWETALLATCWAEGETVPFTLLSGLYLFILQTCSWGPQNRNKET